MQREIERQLRSRELPPSLLVEFIRLAGTDAFEVINKCVHHESFRSDSPKLHSKLFSTLRSLKELLQEIDELPVVPDDVLPLPKEPTK